MKLREALEECTLGLLRKVGESHGLLAEDTALRAELVDQLSRRLLEPGYLEGYLSGLSSVERKLLASVQAQGWEVKAFVLDREFPMARRPGRPQEQPELGSRASLIHKGLLYRSFASLGEWRGEVYHVPEELRAALAASLPPVESTDRSGVTPAVPPEFIYERNCPFDLLCLLSFLRRSDRRLVRGTLGRTDLAKLEAEVGEASPHWDAGRREERWSFLLRLCLASGWLVKRGNSLKPSRNAARALAGGSKAVRGRLLEAYLRDRSWSDLVAAGRVRQALGSRRLDEGAARRLLLHYLEELGGAGWVDENAFCAALREANPDFLREDFASPSWGIVDSATEAEVYGRESWDLVEGSWVRYVLRGPLYWLGTVRCGIASDGKGMAFQLIGRGEPQPVVAGPEGESQGVLQLSPNLDVLAHAEGDLELLYRLEPYVELVARGRENRYRLTRASVLAALESGGSWEELRELFESAKGAAATEGVLRQLEEWVADYGRYVLEEALLLWASTPEDAERLRALPRIAACLGPRLGPNSFRIVPERMWELLQLMRRTGLSPRVDPGVRRMGLRRAAADAELLKESLFALKLVRALHGGIGLLGRGDSLRRLEAALDPEDVDEVSRRVQEVVKRLGGRGDEA